MYRAHPRARCAAVALLTTVLLSCVDDAATPTGLTTSPDLVASMHAAAPSPPPGLVAVGTVDIWPWTGVDLSGTPMDPMNLIFTGDVDVVSLRAALLALDGDRTLFGFPPTPPFNCTWNDAHGGMQATFTTGAGWVGNAIQLECGAYDSVRFHIRLFDAGSQVVAAVHFDLLIPGTPTHQVLGWELPQQLVVVDFLRSGLLSGAPGVQAVSAPSGVQVIPKPIYDGVPDALKGALGLPLGPAAGAAVPIPSDGVASVLDIASRAPVSSDLVEYELSVPFNQVIPRPFCSAGPTDIVHIQGPVELTVSARVNGRGMLVGHNTLRGSLAVTPIDITTGLPSGPTFPARISQVDQTGVGAGGTHVNAITQRKALPPGVGFLKSHLVTAPQGAARFTTSEKCD